MNVKNISSRQERNLEFQELAEVMGGLPTDTVPLAITGGLISGGRSVYSQLLKSGSVNFNKFLQDTNAGIIAGVATSLLTPT